MPWWAWILFWLVFWLLAGVYIGRKVWRLWPHARDFGHVVSDAAQRLSDARVNSAETSSSTGVVAKSDSTEGLPWDLPRSHWQQQYRASKAAQREHKLDEHSEVWRRWGNPVD